MHARQSHIRVAQVAAVANGGVIGAGGALPWRIADDLKWFKQTTMGKPIIMGRKTFASIGKALPGRDTIVVTRDPDFEAPGVFIVRTIPDVLGLAEACANERGADEFCFIGGGEIYAQTLPLADRIYLTRVDAEIEGDVFFPQIDSAQWSETLVGSCAKSEKNEHACEFFILDRRRR